MNMTQSSSAGDTKISRQKSPASSFTWMYDAPLRRISSRTSGSSAMPAPSIGGSINALNRMAAFLRRRAVINADIIRSHLIEEPVPENSSAMDDSSDLAITICHLVYDGTDRLGVSDIAGMVGCLDP
jgi:hypothetical protein